MMHLLYEVIGEYPCRSRIYMHMYNLYQFGKLFQVFSIYKGIRSSVNQRLAHNSASALAYVHIYIVAIYVVYKVELEINVV